MLLKNYFITAIRSLWRHKVFSLINIAGLAIGLGSVLILFLFVHQELSFDKHLKHHKQLYRFVRTSKIKDHTHHDPAISYPLAKTLQKELPGLIKTTTFLADEERTLLTDNQKFKQTGIVFSDTAFAGIFGVEFISGTPEDLANEGKAFLTTRTARKIFGDKEATGKTLRIDDQLTVEVAGIIANPPSNTHLPFRMLVSFSSLNADYLQFSYRDWGSIMSTMGTYGVFAPETDKKATEKRIGQIAKNHNDEPLQDTETLYSLQPLHAIHFDFRFGPYFDAYITAKPIVIIVAAIGLLILVLAAINFVNLSTVQAMSRQTETAMRKVLGADRKRLIGQFLGETFIIVLLAELLAFLIIEIMHPYINAYSGGKWEIQIYHSPAVIWFALIILVIVSLFTGIYPALFMSRKRTGTILYSQGGGMQPGKSLKGYTALVIFQFFIAQILLIGVTVIQKQVQYANKLDYGFRKEQVYNISIPQTKANKMQRLKSRIQALPETKHVTLGIAAPLSRYNHRTNGVKVKGSGISQLVLIKYADSDFNRVFDIPMLAGNWYTGDFDTIPPTRCVVNKQFVSKYGLGNPHDALGTIVNYRNFSMEVVGVTANFMNYSVRRKNNPVLFFKYPEFFYNLYVYSPHFNQNYKNELQKHWEAIYPNSFFEGEFMSEYIRAVYSQEHEALSVIRFFTGLAIILALMGLYGLVAFILAQRTKEIGIRKVLGATTGRLLYTLSRRFLMLILVAGLLAVIPAYFLMRTWLTELYQFHISLTAWNFIYGILLTLAIAWITIFVKVFRASFTNPVDSLRDE